MEYGACVSMHTNVQCSTHRRETPERSERLSSLRLLQGKPQHWGLSLGRQTGPLLCLQYCGRSEVAPDVHPMASSSCSSQRNVPLCLQPLPGVSTSPCQGKTLALYRSPHSQQGLACLPVPQRQWSQWQGDKPHHCPWNRSPHLPQGYQQTSL